MTNSMHTYTPQFALLRTPRSGRVETLVAIIDTLVEADAIRNRCLTAHQYEWRCEPIIWGSSPDGALIRAGAI